MISNYRIFTPSDLTFPSVSREQVYQLLLHHLGHPDHNVVTSCLEALQQILRTPPSKLRPILLTYNAIKETYIYTKDMKGLHVDGRW